MQFTTFTLLAATGANAHMLLAKPQMFPGAGVHPFNNGPISGNYPCRYNGPSTYDFSFERTKLPAGSNYTMSMMGEAVHGGGSCQVSLSKDLTPSANSIFKVIHSIQGGCPARNTPGNLGANNNAEAPDPFTYSFEIPADLEPGQYTFAWSWLNKIGNREFYQNCAPVEVTSGKSKRDGNDTLETRASSYFDSLPNMFYANIAQSDCTTQDSTNMIFPEPGPSLEVNSDGQTSKPVLKSGGSMDKCYAGGHGAGGSPGATAPTNGKNADNSGTSNSAAPPAISSVAAAPVAAPPAISAPAGAPSPASSAQAALPTSIAPAPTAPAAPAASGTCGSGQQTCSSPGSMVCIGASQFGLCDENGCMMPQAVAAGTQCSNGAIAALSPRALRLPPHARRLRRYGN